MNLKCLIRSLIKESQSAAAGIRACISEGQMEDACEMLDRPFSLSGTVIHGKAIGHTIGFATMNLVWPEDKLLVPIGVYLSKGEDWGKHISGNYKCWSSPNS